MVGSSCRNYQQSSTQPWRITGSYSAGYVTGLSALDRTTTTQRDHRALNHKNTTSSRHNLFTAPGFTSWAPCCMTGRMSRHEHPTQSRPGNDGGIQQASAERERDPPNGLPSSSFSCRPEHDDAVWLAGADGGPLERAFGVGGTQACGCSYYSIVFEERSGGRAGMIDVLLLPNQGSR